MNRECCLRMIMFRPRTVGPSVVKALGHEKGLYNIDWVGLDGIFERRELVWRN